MPYLDESSGFELPLTNPVAVFTLVLGIILLSPIIFKKIRIPGIAGLIICGVVVGPNSLNLLGNSDAIELFATIGLLYIMFIAGLELELGEFVENRKKSLLFGALTFAIPLLIGLPVCYHLLGYEILPSLLIAGMFSTHTLVSYPLVSKMGISKNPAVAITIGGTILTDTAVLLLLAVVLGSTQGGLSFMFWLQLIGSLGVYIVLIMRIVPPIARWFFQNLESEKHSHYIFVLLVVFSAALLSQLIGIEPILGAFLAGLVLNRLVPHSSPLMNRVQFIGNALFIPFFLISIGMKVDTAVLTQGYFALYVALVLSVAALFSKWLAAYFTQKALGFTADRRQLIFGLSSSHAAATLAIIMVGFQAGIIDEYVLNGTIILVLITCIVSTMVTERAAARLSASGLADPDHMQVESIEVEHILIPIANIKNTERFLEFALMIKNKQADYPISLLTVLPNDEYAETNVLKAKKEMEAFVVQAAATEGRVQVLATIDYNVVQGITRVAKEITASVLILGWPQRATMVDKVMGERTDRILEAHAKTIFICDFSQSISHIKRICLILDDSVIHDLQSIPSLISILNIAHELKVSFVCFSEGEVETLINSSIKKLGKKVAVQFVDSPDLYQGDVILASIIKGDLLVHIESRKSVVPFLSVTESLTDRLQEQFPNNERLLVYLPQGK